MQEKDCQKNTPRLETERLILRKFAEHDLKDLYEIYRDEEVNEFLPWFPLKALEEAELFYESHLKSRYAKERAYNYAICLKEDDRPIGYINVDMDDSHDLGYGLRKEFWNRGIVTEAGRKIIEQLRKDGVPYITATHDIHNPRSGSVMRRLGMRYQYSYEEKWQPKDILVTFRLYQLNLDGQEDRVYKKILGSFSCSFRGTFGNNRVNGFCCLAIRQRL